MLVPTSLTRGLWLYSGLVALTAYQVAGQDQAALSQSFEGKQVTVKMDMPGSQTGVDIYPNKPQPLDTKSYAARLKSFGVSLRNGDTVMITKVKVKKTLSNSSLEVAAMERSPTSRMKRCISSLLKKACVKRN